MAAVTINSQSQPNVAGHLREQTYDIDIAADADTLAVPFYSVENVIITPQAETSIGYTIAQTASGSTITFQTAGAESGVRVTVRGRN